MPAALPESARKGLNASASRIYITAMTRIRIIASIIIGKMLILLARLLRRGGSSLPGRVALRIAPGLLRTLAARIEGGVVAVTATNGKTTTTRMLAGLVRHAGRPVVTNASGANMAGGIVSAMIEAASLRGRFPRQALGIIEVDEGSIPAVLPLLRPMLLLVGNFFRDQLDRYGEVAILARRVGETIATLANPPRLVINADDPIAASLADTGSGLPVWFGVDAVAETVPVSGGETADIRHCPVCHAPLEYSLRVMGHLGRYHCRGCGRQRPEPDWSAGRTLALGMMQQEYCLAHRGGQSFTVRLSFPGIHAVYNSLGALAVLDQLGLLDQGAIDWLAGFIPPYGRFEKIDLAGRMVFLMLVKNPAGANASLDILAQHAPGGDVLILLNDLAADGRDISWIYDAGFESIAGAGNVTTGGRRADAMALRMLHAGVPGSRIESAGGDIPRALEMAMSKTDPGKSLAIIATYTAMHAIRAVLVRRAGIRDFWKDGT